MPLIPQYLEMMLAFASSTVVTTMLTRISEDVYKHFQGTSLRSLRHQKKTQIRKLGSKQQVAAKDIKYDEELHIRIEVKNIVEKGEEEQEGRKYKVVDVNNELIIEGVVNDQSYKIFIDDIRAMPQMLSQAQQERN